MKDNLDAVTLSDMSVSDLLDVQIIEHQSFTTPWSFQAFLSELVDNDNACYVIAKIERRLVGYIGMWIILDEGHITNVAVDPGYRNRGIGRLLLESMAVTAYQRGVRKMTLEVRVSNKVAQTLYTSLGYRFCGVRPGYYRDNNEDALIMWKDLSKNENEDKPNLRY